MLKCVSLSFLGHHLSRLLSYHVLVSCVFLMRHRSISSEPSAPNPTSGAAPSSSGTSETVKSPSDPSLSPGPRTPEKETQRDGEAEAAPEGETEEEKAIRLLYCSLCKVAVNSASQLQAHNSGEKLKAPPSSSSACLCCVWYVWHSLDVTLHLLRHKAQDNAGGKERRWSHQVLPKDGGQGQVGRTVRVVDWTPEQNFPLWDLRCARQLGDSAQTG